MSAAGEKAVDQAQNIGGLVTAARARDRWAMKEATATDDETRAQYREAVADLESRFPELDELPVGGAEKLARERGHGSRSRSPVHNGRRRQRPGGAAPKKAKSAEPKPTGPERKPLPGLDPTARRSRAQRQAAQGRPTPRVDRAIRRTGIPSAIDSGGSAVLAGLGMTVGLSLAFLVFDSAEKPGTGAAAFPSLVNGATRALGRFLSLGDVFPSNAGVARVQGAPPAAPVSPRQARRQGGRLLGQLPELPPSRHAKKVKGYKFPPQYVTEGGG